MRRLIGKRWRLRVRPDADMQTPLARQGGRFVVAWEDGRP